MEKTYECIYYVYYMELIAALLLLLRHDHHGYVDEI